MCLGTQKWSTISMTAARFLPYSPHFADLRLLFHQHLWTRYRVAAMDMRGHGETRADHPEDLSLGTLVQVLKAHACTPARTVVAPCIQEPHRIRPLLISE